MIVDHLRDNIAQLIFGWDERIEYKVRINENLVEARAKTVFYDALLMQLEKAGLDKPPADGMICERMPPNKPGSRPPGNMDPTDLILEVRKGVRGLYAAHWRLHASIGVTQSTEYMLGEILLIAARNYEAGNGDDYARHAVTTTGKWIRSARRVLGYDERPRMLADTVCGECGGGLVILPTVVKCAGTPEVMGCGVRYERHDWLALALLAQQEAAGE